MIIEVRVQPFRIVEFSCLSHLVIDLEERLVRDHCHNFCIGPEGINQNPIGKEGHLVQIESRRQHFDIHGIGKIGPDQKNLITDFGLGPDRVRTRVNSGILVEPIPGKAHVGRSIFERPNNRLECGSIVHRGIYTLCSGGPCTGSTGCLGIINRVNVRTGGLCGQNDFRTSAGDRPPCKAKFPNFSSDEGRGVLGCGERCGFFHPVNGQINTSVHRTGSANGQLLNLGSSAGGGREGRNLDDRNMAI